MKMLLTALAAATLFSGCGKKPAPAKAPEPSATERAALAGSPTTASLGGAPKRIIDQAKTTLDTAQARETQTLSEVK